ncbi:alpha-amylase/4-alpha-glucanotransferase domain-containing protein [Botrimarina hoheduenensis]|uniref:Alpha-amylase 1 n=1 Tax=Botrimarina hoheduenensis TaxID=2528000 RepID=A0A5C5W750_9BACT|nr:alpha-amylase/4-alpha-glucanotransferase domain-containing protein [Botrimarina hoheduenensis]TWT46434.1 Alpha-amylase 1 [Botrimarina hoheduenensis]
MSEPLRLVLVLHNHQPIGNFDGVCEQAYEDSYLPFLDVFEQFQGLAIGLHTSGSLMEWLAERHPEYLHRLARLVSEGRIEVLGGPFFEPILTMIPSRDRVGQIRRYTEWLTERLGAKVRGMWMPERVWEQSLTRDLVEAGMEYTILDDFHFKNAGWTSDELHGYYLTEEDTRLLSVFPGSERLRYTIPFAEPHETIDHLRHVAAVQPGAIVVFGDDGEKLGTWPNTKDHVYKNGWLKRFFEALQANRDWLKLTTPSEALDAMSPLGKIYIPEGSYREMTEWALPARQQNLFHDAKHQLEDEHRWEAIAPFARGGFWRNFKVRYPETGDMYARMQMVSRRLAEARADQPEPGTPSSDRRCELLDHATTALYRGQCNCSYWHGAFGGVYLPHLRHAVYNQLIAAENLIDQSEGRGLPTATGEAPANEWVELDTDDYNLDARQEVRLASNRLVALLAPQEGAELYELDVRAICLNVGATLARREEAYHRKVLAGPSAAGGNVASIHELVVFKQEGLNEHLQYDERCRRSLVDHFYDLDTPFEGVRRGEAREAGDFVGAPYETKLRRKPERMQVLFTRDGHVDGHPIRLTKGVTLDAGSATLEIAYLLEGLPNERPLHFSTELNFAGLPAGADDRFFYTTDPNDSLGNLSTTLDLGDQTELHAVDNWLGIDMGVVADRPTSFWTYPLSTVSQSEGGFELVNQSVVIQPHWILQGDANGRWSVALRVTADTSLAEQRALETVAEVATV